MIEENNNEIHSKIFGGVQAQDGQNSGDEEQREDNSNEHTEEKEQSHSNNKKESSEAESGNEDKNNSREEDTEEKADKENSRSEEILDLKETLNEEKTRRQIVQKSFHKANNKIKMAERLIEEYMANGQLTEEEARKGLDLLKMNAEDIPDLDGKTLSDNSDINFTYGINEDAINEGLAGLEEIDPDFDETKAKKYDNYLEAFSYNIKNVDSDEREAINSHLNTFNSNTRKAKEVLKIGKEIYDSGFKSLKDHGSIQNMQLAHEKELIKKDKIIDSLNKKLLNYSKNEDYLTNSRGTYNISSSGYDGNVKDIKKHPHHRKLFG